MTSASLCVRLNIRHPFKEIAALRSQAERANVIHSSNSVIEYIDNCGDTLEDDTTFQASM